MSKNLYQDVSFGMIADQNMRKSGFPYNSLNNYSEKEKAMIMQITKKAALRLKKPKPKQGIALAFKEAKQRQEFMNKSKMVQSKMNKDGSLKRSLEDFNET